jgi:FAD/FMN-containing dehydrogenase
MTSSPVYDGVLRAFKRSLDPNHILSPGRYQSAE